MSEDIAEVSKKLKELNKKNLTDTYRLEDLQEEYDWLLDQLNLSKTFQLTQNRAIFMRKEDIMMNTLSKANKGQKSYATLEKENPGAMAQVIQSKIDQVLGVPSSGTFGQMSQGRIQAKNKPVVPLGHPEVDMSKLTPKQRADIEAKIKEIRVLQKEQIYIKKEGLKQTGQQYEKQRKNLELEEFYEQCLKAY